MNLTELLRKYNVAGPRYTSYPTVPYWEHSPSEQVWIQSIDQALQDSEEREKGREGCAIYIHIPFCERLCTYCGCNTRITRNKERGSEYVLTVLKEWKLYQEKLGRKSFPLSEIHLGGGTPTFLSPQSLHTLMSGILDATHRLQDSEFSIEVDPRVTTEDHLIALKELGFKRMSMGIQDFDPKVQETVHRVQSVEQVRSLTELARKHGFTSINYDLIYGLPFQTLESIQNTIQKVSELKPDRIAFYSYAHVPWIKPSHRRFTEKDLPRPEEKRALYELGLQLLEAAGYQEIGMDHFALRSDSLWKAHQDKTLHRNFMGYISRRVSPLIGLGVSAIGDSWRVFSQNEKVLERYQERIHQGEIPILRGHVLTAEDLEIRKLILDIMTQFETSWSDSVVAREHLQSLPEKLNELVRDGLVDVSNDQLVVRNEGRPFIRNICMALDARLARKSPETQLFSQTI